MKKKPIKTTTTKKESRKGKPTWVTEAKEDGLLWVDHAKDLNTEIRLVAEQIMKIATTATDLTSAKESLIRTYSTLNYRMSNISIPINRHFGHHTEATSSHRSYQGDTASKAV